MINKIIDGICGALHKEFGKDYTIYTEDIEQGFEDPCFLVCLINSKTDQLLGTRKSEKNQFCVHYFPGTDDKNSECNDIRARLTPCLEWITVGGDPVRGCGISGRSEDGALLFFINYNINTIEIDADPEMMEGIEIATEVEEV